VRDTQGARASDIGRDRISNFHDSCNRNILECCVVEVYCNVANYVCQVKARTTDVLYSLVQQAVRS
jgi:hypothetical protein